ncbi:acetylcholine receptor subunit beta-like 1 [Manduca sexta]|uniref:acetylcholine receptor subunit beta-like 1 n=1 Tax=Manduca sexta TaxID=7130 RepID=UPI00188EBD29|nr:acetylcholine receptor subunit beta-like 1 [Manduca sexta]
MMLCTFFIFILLKQSLQDCIIDDTTPVNVWEQRLHKDLKLKPELSNIPCDRNGVEVKLRLNLKWFNYDSNQGAFAIYSWVMLTWNNNKITWNPADYNGLNETLILNSDMWYPEIKLMNSIDSEQSVHFFFEQCAIRSSGEIFCIYKMVDSAICNSDLTKWPYDTQSCSVKFGVWKNKNNTVRLKTAGRAVRMIGADYGMEWDIIDYKQEENQGAETQLTMTFVIERHAETVAATLIYPSIALSTLSIVSFTLDVRRMTRFGLVCFNIANHFSFLTELQENMPGHSFYTPSVLFYYRGSMLTNIFLFLLTLMLAGMCKREKVPPLWVSFVNDIVYKGRGKMLVWPKWESEVGANEFAEQWTNFANIINSVFFIVTVIVYVCLYFVYMPQPPPLNY